MVQMTENPNKLSADTLNKLEQKILSNKIDIEDLKILESFMSSILYENYLLSQFRESGINSFDDFIFEKSKPEEKRNRVVDGYLMGVLTGAINSLKKYIN